MTIEEFLKNKVFIKRISKRSFSEIDLVEYEDRLLIWKRMSPNGPNNEVSRELLIDSYKNYKSLICKIGLVDIYMGWWDGERFNTVMEYLDGYKRLSDLEQSHEFCEFVFKKLFSIIGNFISQGFIDYDIDPTNFMINMRTGDIKMVDIDKVMRLEDVCADRGHYGSWFASRLIRMFLWYQGEFDPGKQYTEVKKI